MLPSNYHTTNKIALKLLLAPNAVFCNFILGIILVLQFYCLLYSCSGSMEIGNKLINTTEAKRI